MSSLEVDGYPNPSAAGGFVGFDYTLTSDGTTVVGHGDQGQVVAQGTDVGAVANTVLALLPATGGAIQFRNDGNVFPSLTRIAIPIGVTNLLYIEGNGATIHIQPAAATPTAFKFNTSADYQAVNNILIRNFVVDRNNIASASHTVLHPGYTQRINVDNFTMERIRVINCPGPATSACFHIVISSTHLANGETQTHLTNINISDIKATGGQGCISITGPKPAGGANCEVFHDNIVIERVVWDATLTPAGANLASGIQVGGTGFGQHCTIRDSVISNASDDAVEVDGMQDALVENVEAIDFWNNAVLFGNFHNPPNVNAQVNTARNVKATIISAVNATALAAFKIAATTAPLNFGHAILEDCSLDHQGNILAGTNGLAILAGSNGSAGPLQKLTVMNFQVTAMTIADTTAAGVTTNLITVVPSTNCIVTIKGTRINIAGSSTNTTNCNLRGILIGGKTSATPTITFVIEDTTIESNVTGLTGTRATWIYIGGGSTATLGGNVKGTRIITGVFGTTDTAIRVDSTATLTISGRILITEGNHLGLPAAGTDFTVDSTQTALGAVVTIGNVWKTKPVPVGLTGFSTTVGKVLGSQSAAVLWPCMVTFTQGSGTSDTAIDYSTNGGTTYTNFLTQASGALPAGFDQSLGPLLPADLIKVTFTGTQPTTTLVPVNP